MILGTAAIRERLEKGEIFRSGTWISGNVGEASYELRVASDGLILEDGPIPPDSLLAH